mmetsp:Transcript_17609/g.42375  ORF Transcript_17609/g.42375 Transcript_17609/m.42375 type:complete len:85 (+) Transcript_17609:557-811(+)
MVENLRWNRPFHGSKKRVALMIKIGFVISDSTFVPLECVHCYETTDITSVSGNSKRHTSFLLGYLLTSFDTLHSPIGFRFSRLH